MTSGWFEISDGRNMSLSRKKSRLSYTCCRHSWLNDNEHDVRVVATEWGVADLRGKGPDERARLLIENCAHPDYRNLLWDYLRIAKNGHVSHNVAAALALNTTYEREGDMRKIDWGRYL